MQEGAPEAIVAAVLNFLGELDAAPGVGRKD
jgi:hypothetical protein